MARVLVHVAEDRRLAVDPERISHVHAQDAHSRVLRPGAEPLDDLRKLGAIEQQWKAHGFVRIHEACLVNPRWVRELIRVPGTDRRWQLVLDDDAGTSLDVERERISGLWAAFGER